MGQTRHGFPWVPKSWGGHSSGIWELYVSSKLKDVCLTTAGIVMWICVCSFSAVLLDLSTFKKEWSRLCLLSLFIKGREKWTEATRCINVTLHSKIKNIGNLYTKKTNDSWNICFKVSHTYTHRSVNFFHMKGPFFFTVSREQKVASWRPFSTKEIQESGDDSRQSGTSGGTGFLPDFGGGHFFSVWSTGGLLLLGAHANLRQMGLFSQF